MTTTQQLLESFLRGEISPRGLKAASLRATPERVDTHWTLLAEKKSWGILGNEQNTVTSKRHFRELKHACQRGGIKFLSTLHGKSPAESIEKVFQNFRISLQNSLRARSYFPHLLESFNNEIELASLENIPFKYGSIITFLQIIRRNFPDHSHYMSHGNPQERREEAQSLITLLDSLK